MTTDKTADRSGILRRGWNGLRRAWAWLRQSESDRRLTSVVGPYRTELEFLFSRFSAKPHDISREWYDRATQMLGQAEADLALGETERAWQCFYAAQRLELHGLAVVDRDAFQAKARSVLNEANEKLSDWRKQSVLDALTHDGEFNARVSPDTMAAACQVLFEHHTNLYRRLRLNSQQLIWLGATGIAALLGWLIGLAGQIGGKIEIANLPLLWSAAVFGVMGACASGIISLANNAPKGRIPERLLTLQITLARPLVGAVAAVAIYTFLLAGLLNLNPVGPGLALAAAFAAGFSERLLTLATEAVK